jgi:hypothetical protein
MVNMSFEDADHDQVFEKGDTVFLKGDFFNYLAPTSSSFNVRLDALTPYITLLDSVFTAGIIPGMSSVSNTANPFAFYIDQNIPASFVVNLKLIFTDTAYNSLQYTSITVNSDFLTVDTNMVAITVTSDGGLGYNKGISTQGVGITYNQGLSLMSNGGFLMGVSPSQVSDAVEGFTGTLDHDFSSLTNVQKQNDPLHADYEALGEYDDSPAGTNQMHIRVKQREMAWDRPGREKFVIVEFCVVNDGSSMLSDFYAGCYIDWDVKNYMQNSVSWDPDRKMGYVFPYDGGIHTGIQLLSDAGVYHYAFDKDGAESSINLNDGFSGFEKYYALHSNRHQAGTFLPGNDVADLVSTGPFTIYPGDSASFAFAILVGDHLSDLQQVADSAILAYGLIMGIKEAPDPEANFVIYPNPVEDQLIIKVGGAAAEIYSVTITDILGNQLSEVVVNNFFVDGSSLIIPCNSMPCGIYILNILTADGKIAKKMLKI